MTDVTGYTIRPHTDDDLEWVIRRHGELYDMEYGWGDRFAAIVADVVESFPEEFDPTRERGWIATRGQERVGCIFLVPHPDRAGVAKLRLLLVDPSARGLGIGRRLVHECTAFARHAGYHTITLWTSSVLGAARRIYQAEGYRLVDEEPHDLFGEGVVGQTWELAITDRHGARELEPDRTPSS